MTNSVSYKYVPNQSVYVINTLGPNGQYPYWGFPYPFGCGYPFGGPVGFPGNYPNGFTSTTPAIQSGVVLQVRILFTTSNPSVATIMYDVRVTGEMGTTPFPENMVFPATAGVAGFQTVEYAAPINYNTVIAVTNLLSDTVYVDGTPVVLQLPPPTIAVPSPVSMSALLSILNNKYNGQATFTITGGNLVVTSAVTGEMSSIIIVENATPANSLLNTLAAGMVIDTAVPGVASGLDQAQAFYATLNL